MEHTSIVNIANMNTTTKEESRTNTTQEDRNQMGYRGRKNNCVGLWIERDNNVDEPSTRKQLRIALDSGNNLVHPVIASNIVDELKMIGIIPRRIKLKE